MEYIFLHVEPMLWGACLWYWLWTLGAFLLGALLAWLLSRGDDHDDSALIAERDRYRADAVRWEKDYNSLKYQLEETQKSEADLRAALQRCEADKQTMKFDMGNTASAAAGFVAGKLTDGDDSADATIIPAADLSGSTGSAYDGLFEQDNFQIIEGVGPKVNQVLIDAGYRTWADLSVADPADLRRHLDAAGKNFSLSDPTSWPHQAKLAAAGDWDELIRYQKFTDGGRETVGDFESDSKFEKLAAKKLGFSSANPNDLKVVEGVGPKIEGLLKAGGITTWAELAAADVDRLQQILNDAGSRYKLATPRTWPQQASLAAEGRWQELRELQEDLKGGV